jgi:phage tail sheath protein FI
MPLQFPNVPGVQINEQRLDAPAIFGISTSIAGFVGKAPKDTDAAQRNKPFRLTSGDQFASLFIQDATRSTPLSRAVMGFFNNGGTACWVVNVGSDGATETAGGITLLEPIDEITLLAAPGQANATVWTALKEQAERTGDRFALLDPPVLTAEQKTKTTTRLMPKSGAEGGESRPPESIFAAYYYPQILVGPQIVEGQALKDDPQSEAVTPIGHIAGLYARIDTNRGVHKAPANDVLFGALGVEHVLTDSDQNSLNPAGVNLLRVFSGNVVVWGARTLQASPPINADYRYINVRRLVSYVAESLQDGLRFAVFEPNTLALRQQIARSARGFLDGVWRDGGLFGATPAQAYYVRFPDIYNRDVDRAAGQLTVEIGLRVTFPAEFVIIRIGVLLRDASTV